MVGAPVEQLTHPVTVRLGAAPCTNDAVHSETSFPVGPGPAPAHDRRVACTPTGRPGPLAAAGCWGIQPMPGLHYRPMSATPPDEAPAPEVRVSVYARRALSRWYVIVLAVIVGDRSGAAAGREQGQGQDRRHRDRLHGPAGDPGRRCAFANPPYANLSAVTKLISLRGSPYGGGTRRQCRPRQDHHHPRVTQRQGHRPSAFRRRNHGVQTRRRPRVLCDRSPGPVVEPPGGGDLPNTLAGIVVHKANGYVDARWLRCRPRSPPPRSRSRGYSRRSS